MSEQDTSSTAGATPNVDTAATATPAPGGATPQKPSVTLEEALSRIAELEHAHKNATEERDRHRKKLSSYEEAERKAQEAQLSEIERIRKQHAELQAQHDTYTRQMQERIVRYEVEAQARKLNIIDPDAAAKLLDWSELEYDDDGTPTNAAKLLDKLLKNKPYLAPAQQQAQQTQTTPAQSSNPLQGKTPAIPAMNPGRTTIQAPGSTPPGRPPRLSDVFKRP